MACNWVRFSYRLLPLPGWRAFLLDRHIDGCPACREAALGDDAIRSLGVTPAVLENEPPLQPFASRRPAQRPGAFRFRWSYAYGVFLALVAVAGVAVVSRLVPGGPQGRVFVSEPGDEPSTFAVLDARVGDHPAQPVIFKTGQPGMTIVWFEKASN